MMRTLQKLIVILLIIVALCLNTFPPEQALAFDSTSSSNWYEVDKSLVQMIQQIHDSTEDFARNEINNWTNELLKKVDNNFLDWYFSYGNQKAMDFGVPFAWAVFQLDSALKVLRKEDEIDLNADQIIQKRMIEDFNSKFNQLVLNEESESVLKNIINNIGRNYASSVGFRFAQVKNYYQIPDVAWDEHLRNIAELIYSDGNSATSLSATSLNSNLMTRLAAVTSITIAGKLTANFAAKAGSKLLSKTGTSLITKTGAKAISEAGAAMIVKTGTQILDPILVVGFLAWDIWDYQKMVADSRPELRQSIADYLQELAFSIIDAPDNSIMAGIEDIENIILHGLEYQQS